MDDNFKFDPGEIKKLIGELDVIWEELIRLYDKAPAQKKYMDLENKMILLWTFSSDPEHLLTAEEHKQFASALKRAIISARREGGIDE